MNEINFEPLSPRERGRGEGAPHAKLPLPEETLAFARQLRAQQTNAEDALWFLLRDRRFLNFKFRRQHAIPPYVLDFYCSELKLAVELDGGQHNEDAVQRIDEKRSLYLRARGIEVVRYWNHDVLARMESVLEDLMQRAQVQARSLTPAPLPEGEGKAKNA